MVRLPRIFPKVEVSFEYTHMWDGKSKKKKKAMKTQLNEGLSKY